MCSEHLDHGRLAEDKAAEWLEDHGYNLIARNVNYRIGEIDIVASIGTTLCFVEVRSRNNNRFDKPEASIRSSKQAKLIKAATLYLQKNYNTPPLCRFDVVAVTGYGPEFKIKHIPHAFTVAHYPRSKRGNPWQAY
ncbi:MAG: YraN family protein [bacterium]|nr:YraN family protein [bacterium]